MDPPPAWKTESGMGNNRKNHGEKSTGDKDIGTEEERKIWDRLREVESLQERHLGEPVGLQ